MAVIDHEAGLARAGANVRGRFGAMLFFVRRYPLGAVGAVIMMAFVTTAIFADAISHYDPLSTNARASLAPPGEKYTCTENARPRKRPIHRPTNISVNAPITPVATWIHISVIGSSCGMALLRVV